MNTTENHIFLNCYFQRSYLLAQKITIMQTYATKINIEIKAQTSQKNKGFDVSSGILIFLTSNWSTNLKLCIYWFSNFHVKHIKQASDEWICCPKCFAYALMHMIALQRCTCTVKYIHTYMEYNISMHLKL